jgi:hypothetical protein
MMGVKHQGQSNTDIVASFSPTEADEYARRLEEQRVSYEQRI